MINVSFWNIAFTVVNLLILFVAMRIFLFKPIQDIIAKRQEEADALFNQATDEEHQAQELKAQYEHELEDAEATKKQIVAEARKTADVEVQHMIADAKKEAKHIHDDAVVEAQHAKEEIMKKAEKEIADMVVEATTKIVGTKAGADVDSALYDEFLGKAGDQ